MSRNGGMVILNPGLTRVIVIQTRKWSGFSFPCGKLNEGENIFLGTKREVEEETGILFGEDAPFLPLLAVVGRPDDYWFTVISEDVPLIEGPEGVPFWVTVQEVREATGKWAEYNSARLEEALKLWED